MIDVECIVFHHFFPLSLSLPFLRKRSDCEHIQCCIEMVSAAGFCRHIDMTQ